MTAISEYESTFPVCFPDVLDIDGNKDVDLQRHFSPFFTATIFSSMSKSSLSMEGKKIVLKHGHVDVDGKVDSEGTGSVKVSGEYESDSGDTTVTGNTRVDSDGKVSAEIKVSIDF
jgi:hypothetical protein